MVLIGLFYLSRTQAVAPDQPRPIATYVIPVTGDTAKIAYLKALAQAQGWQNDVILVAVSTSWTGPTIQGLGQAPIWNFRFFSPGHDRLYFSLVTTDGQAIGRTHIYKLGNAPPLLDPAAWVVDSDEAITTWANQGGGAFIQTFPDSRVEAMLRHSPERNGPVWDIIGMSVDQSQLFYVRIDATSGEVLNE
jgi:hypothetical protein